MTCAPLVAAKSAPPLEPVAPGSPRKSPGRNGFSYKPQFGIIVLCDDEADQTAKYADLRGRGFTLKVVAV